MAQSECRYESQIFDALHSGELPMELAQHVSTCASCREVVAVYRSLKIIADKTEMPVSLPNHRLIWLKAQVIKRQERAARLELLSRVGAVAAVCVAVIVSFCWHWFGPSTDQVSTTAVDWIRLLRSASPIIVALLLLGIVNSVRPRARNRWF